jgi:hypothetical protein
VKKSLLVCAVASVPGCSGREGVLSAACLVARPLSPCSVQGSAPSTHRDLGREPLEALGHCRGTRLSDVGKSSGIPVRAAG